MSTPVVWESAVLLSQVFLFTFRAGSAAIVVTISLSINRMALPHPHQLTHTPSCPLIGRVSPLRQSSLGSFGEVQAVLWVNLTGLDMVIYRHAYPCISKTSLLSELFTMTFPPEVHGRASVIPFLPPRRQHLSPRARPVTSLLGHGFSSEGAVTSGSADSALQAPFRGGGTEFCLRAPAAFSSVPQKWKSQRRPDAGGC